MAADVIRVLVVDDHALHRDGIRQILGQHPDIQLVGEAESAELALVLIGIEATRRIHRDHPGTRVLVVTAYDDEEYIRGALEAGASGHLSKAAPGRQLIDAVRAVAAGGTVIEPVALTHLLAGGHSIPPPATQLTERERAVLELLAQGLHNKQVATRLGISRRTVERHCDNIYDKLGVGSRTEAVVQAISAKLVSLPDDQH